ncbi:MAG TPA: branched-chain-amino acid aminotransferase, partial [Sorangium sp.]|nr:branched-chain-amino acid aminotransferase [Sorangium sp.]
MGRVVFINGAEVAPERATVSVYDRGFLYGDSVFETVRSYGGKLFALDEHLQRLARSADSMGIALPLPMEALAAEVRRAVAASGNEDSYVRMMLTRGSGPLGLDPNLAGHPLRVIFVHALEAPPAALYQRGVTVSCVQTVRASDAAPSAKLGNYFASVLALRTARARGAQEALVVNRDGLVVEGTTSNVFVLRAGVLTTPPLSAGVLAGITRAVVVDIIADLGLAFEERA